MGGKSPSVASSSKQANAAHTLHPRLQRARLHRHLARHREPRPQRDPAPMAAVLDTTSYTFTQFERLVPLTSVRPPAGVFNATFADHGFSNLRTCTAVPGTAFDLTFNLTGARRLIFKGGLSASVPLSMWWWDIRTAGKRGLVTIRTDGGEQRVVPVLELGISSVEIDQELRADGGAAPAYEGFIDATGVSRGKTEVSGYGLVEIVVLGVFDY